MVKNYLKAVKIAWNTYIVAPLRKIFKFNINLKLFPEDKEDERLWREHEKERKAQLKKEHRFLYYTEKFEPIMMYGGFALYMIEPFVRQSPIAILARILGGGAMGLGLSNWLMNKHLWKMNFLLNQAIKSFLKGIEDAMGGIDKPRIKGQPKRSD